MTVPTAPYITVFHEIPQLSDVDFFLGKCWPVGSKGRSWIAWWWCELPTLTAPYRNFDKLNFNWSGRTFYLKVFLTSQLKQLLNLHCGRGYHLDFPIQKLQNSWVVKTLMRKIILCKILIFLNLRHTKTVEYIRLNLFGWAWCAMRFYIFVTRSETRRFMLMREIL